MTTSVTDRDGEARRSVLSAIRRALAASASVPPPAGSGERATSPAASAVPGSAEGPAPLIEAFRRSVVSASGSCSVARSQAEAAAAIDRILEERGLRTVAVSDSPLVEAVIGRLRPGPTVLRDADATALFGCDVGISGAQWAVAETGTLVLRSDSERHRLASLVPPAHIAVISADSLRWTIADVLAELARAEPSPAITFITGPSRTSDIELTLAIGVHGPGQLDVILLDARSGRPPEGQGA